jgi:hypothetical protein
MKRGYWRKLPKDKLQKIVLIALTLVVLGVWSVLRA